MDDLFSSPFIHQTDLSGWYPADSAAVAARTTACDPGSGPCRIDD
jgi:hypothetical protein